MKKRIALIVCAALLLSLFSGCAGKSDEKDKGTFTLMVYMVGSDLESKYMAASNDLSEMLDSDLSLDNVNLLVYTGGSKMWYADVPSDANATLLMKEDDGKKTFEQIEKTDELKNMGEAETLSGFLQYAYDEYSADHYGLICWDHGTGPLGGFGSDTQFMGDSIELSELNDALKNSPFNDEKLNFVGFDACLMSSIEVADTLSPYANYMIASQETEPGDGWNYSFLETLNDSFDTEEIADSIISSYYSHYEEQKSETFSPDLTLSCLDLSKTGEMTEAMNTLFSAMEGTLNSGSYQRRAVKRSGLKSFGESGSRGWSLDMVDYGGLISACEDDFEEESAAAKEAFDSFVVLNKTNMNDAGGVSIYYPYNGFQLFAKKGVDKYKNFYLSEGYKSYMDTYTRTWSQSWLKSDNTVDTQSEAIAGSNTEQTGETLTVKLTDEQKKSFSKAYLNIFRKDSYVKDFYIPALYHVQVSPDQSGDIVISAGAKIPTINGKIPFALKELSKDGERTNYQSFSTYVSIEQSIDRIVEHPVTIYCSVDNDSEDIIINSIEYDNDETDGSETGQRSGKSTLNASRWQYLNALNIGGTPVRDENGALLPFSEWDLSGGNFNCKLIDSSLKLKMTDIDKFKKDAEIYYQVEIEDVYGKRSSTELQKFEKTPESVREHTEKTAKGTVTYELHDSYARLVKYEGTDTALTIPETVAGIPVTQIDNQAFKTLQDNKATMESITFESPDFDFSECGNLNIFKKVVLPDGLKHIPPLAFSSMRDGGAINIPDTVESIGAKAFTDYYIPKKLSIGTLPKGLQKISNAAFCGITFIGGLNIDSENEYYEVKDDMLLTKDGKKLLAYFGTDTALTVPDGVQEIGSYTHIATDDSQLTSIAFPDTLKRIDYCAFSGDCFETLDFPDSVEEIGHYAFLAGTVKREKTEDLDYGLSYSTSLDDVFTVSKIHFGKKLRWIGDTIIGGGRYKELTVSDDNRFYAVKHNRLTNKHGDADLSEVALSSSDNLKDNEKEYKAYKLISDNVDLSLYDKPEEEKYHKSFEGNKYCLEMTLKESEQTKYKAEKKVTMLGKEITLPCPYSQIEPLLKGMKQLNDPLPEKTEPDDTTFVKVKDKDNKNLTVWINNKTDKALPVGECTVYGLDFGNFMKKDTAVDFNYCGITPQSDFSEVIKALGNPSSVTIKGDPAYFRLEYEEVDPNEKYAFLKNKAELTFFYDEQNDQYALCEINIEMKI